MQRRLAMLRRLYERRKITVFFDECPIWWSIGRVLVVLFIVNVGCDVNECVME